MRQTEDRFSRFGAKSLVVSKFLPGFNVIASPMSGALGVSLARFLVFSISGSLLWSGTGIAIGAYFHRSVDQVLVLLGSMGTTALIIVLSLLALFVLFKYVERRRYQQAMRIERITMAQLRTLLADGHAPVIIDARSATAQQLEPAIPGALLFNHAGQGALIATLDKDRHIVVYCSCPNDVTAAQVAKLLLGKGFHRARPLHGGLDAWHADQGRTPSPPTQALG